MWCIVNLPNGTQQAVKCDPKAIGQECLEKVCKALNIICEMEYFGLEHWTPNQKESRSHQWINLRNRLSQDSGSGSSIQLMLAIRVKFWVPVHLILQESARNLFYMQAKVDLIEGRLLAKDWQNAAKLSALLCQADGIRFNEASLKAKCPKNLKNLQQPDTLNAKEKKEKEPVLAFKKRRLSKQKSVESFDVPSTTTVAALTTAIALGATAGTTSNAAAVVTSNSQPKQRPPLQRQSYSLGSATSSGTSSIFSSILHSHASNTANTTHASTSASNNNDTSSSSTASASASHNTSSTSTASSNNSTSGYSFKKFSFSSSSSTSTDSLHHNNNNSSSNSSSSSSSNSSGTEQTDHQQLSSSTEDDVHSPLRIYEDYLIRTTDNSPYPDEYLRAIAIEHGKLAKLKMSPKSAKYWLLKEIQDLSGYGEEVFSGVTVNESSVRCDVAVGAHGISVVNGDEKNSIPFSAIAAAKSFRRAFKLEYVNDHNERKELEIKLPKHCIAAGLYRSITERHAFYVCDKVRFVVTSQFTRDLKGTIASMFKEDTELGKRYVFDIQRTCREVHDQARRILYERGIEITTAGVSSTSTVDSESSASINDLANYLPSSVDSVNGKIDLAIKEKEEREATIERCVGSRITEAMTCKICMDREINSMFNPCGHVTACSNCASKCDRCPNCRIKITSVVKVFLPTELRNSTTKHSVEQQQEQQEQSSQPQSLNDKHYHGVLIEASF